MSVIQKIQDKYAKLMAIIIAVALMIFVVMLAFENGGSLFRGGNSSIVGKVNGTPIEYKDFMKKVDQQEKALQAQYAQYGGSPAGLQQQAIDNAWNQEINDILENSELDKLGIKVGKKEMGDILYGPNAPDELKKIFTDTVTGIYNGQMAKQQLDATIRMKKGTAEQLAQRDQVIVFMNYHENTRLRDKYNSLLSNSINYPKWFIEKQVADNSQLAKIALVRNNYSQNADSSIKVSDKEIQEYLDNHKKDFKQQMQESRSIAYVAFSTLPGAADSAAAKDKILALKPEFDTTKNIQKFLAAQGVNTFYDSYLNGAAIQIPAKDSIFKIPVGSVYGPYLDASSFSLGKLLGVRQQPDTVKVRHILISTSQPDPQSGQMYPVRDTATAKKLIDSIQTAIRNGSNFDTLCSKLSEDPGKKDQQTGKFNGGVYDKVTAGRMVAEFNEFIFGNPVGTKGIVKTDFGYHYIEILSAKGRSSAYKIAYLSKPIETSTETESNASNMAAQFAGNSRDQKSFDANAEKSLKQKGVTKNIAPDITPGSYQVPGLGQSRTLVKNVFKADLGDVLEPEKVGENYVVAIVTEINEEGKLSAAKARINIEPILRNKKIAEKLKLKAGNVTTLEAAAATFGGKPIETIDSLRMLGEQKTEGARAISSEPKVIGAAFNPSNRGKVVPQVIEGVSALFVVRVDNVMATSVADANIAEQRKTRKQQAQNRSPMQALRESATIKDRRINFF